MVATARIDIRTRARGMWRVRTARLLLELAPFPPALRLANRLTAPGVTVQTSVNHGPWRDQKTVHLARLEV